MLKYDASRDPEPSEWLAMDEDMRMSAVRRHHQKHRPHDTPPSGLRAHAALHAVVETQLAENDPPDARAALARLQAEGLSRHEAIHAIASLVGGHLFEAARGKKFDRETYCAQLREVTPESWQARFAEEKDAILPLRNRKDDPSRRVPLLPVPSNQDDVPSRISEHLVERTWRDVARLDRRDSERAVSKFAERQPELLTYVSAAIEDCRVEVQELAIYLLFVVYRMFSIHSGGKLKKISAKQVMRRVEKNEEFLQSLENAHERFFERIAQVQLETQPHVLRYLTEAILEPDEEAAVELTHEEEGLLLVVLKNAIDLLEAASPQ